MFALIRRTASPKYVLDALKWEAKVCSTVKASSHQTVKDIHLKLIKILNAESGHPPEKKDKVHLMKYLAKTQEELPVRKMSHSRDNAIIPLSTDDELKEKYNTFHGTVRIGRLMEDVDMFAVWCCTKHLLGPSSINKPFPYIIVTILIDRIYMLTDKFKSMGDIRLSGHVSWVGKTSMEVTVNLDGAEDGVWKPMTKAFLLMAVRNPLTMGPAIANPLQAETPEEKQIMLGAEERKLRRQRMQKDSIIKKLPSEEELQLIHDLLMKKNDSEDFRSTTILPPKSRWMGDAGLQNLVFCHPEFKNLHNKIFGGFLARQAVELSWITAYLYGSRKSFPQLVKISDIRFFHPVEVGAVLKFQSTVTYTEGEFIQIFVFAEVVSQDSIAEGRHTTTFNFTFKIKEKCDTIYPSTYLEAMNYIEGRRHLHPKQ